MVWRLEHLLLPAEFHQEKKCFSEAMCVCDRKVGVSVA